MNTDRRRLLGLLAGVAAGGAGASAFARTGRADAGATFGASDVTVRTHDGALDAVTVAPAGTVSWSGLEEPAGSVALSLYAKLDSALRFRELDGQRLDATGLHGEADYQFGTRDLLDGPGFSAADFEPDDGETRTRTVRLRLSVAVYATDGTELTAGYTDATFDVTVENRPESETVTGRANAGAESAGETTEAGTAATTTEQESTGGETTTEQETNTAETTTGTTTGTTAEESGGADDGSAGSDEPGSTTTTDGE